MKPEKFLFFGSTLVLFNFSTILAQIEDVEQITVFSGRPERN